jgi:hypothetical protein
MITIIRFFKEKTNEDYKQYAIEWDNNKYRMAWLTEASGRGLTKKQQLDFILHDIQTTPTKDIFAIRFLNPNKNIFNNEIVKKILSGEGITYNNGVWIPSEIWIYN